MAAGPSAWRVNNAVAYDALREQAGTLTALLLQREQTPGEARDAVIALRAKVNTIAGFDRTAVDAATAEIEGRIRQLEDHR
jgi:hypothetical protein